MMLDWQLSLKKWGCGGPRRGHLGGRLKGHRLTHSQVQPILEARRCMRLLVRKARVQRILMFFLEKKNLKDNNFSLPLPILSPTRTPQKNRHPKGDLLCSLCLKPLLCPLSMARRYILCSDALLLRPLPWFHLLTFSLFPATVGLPSYGWFSSSPFFFFFSLLLLVLWTTGCLSLFEESLLLFLSVFLFFSCYCLV